MYLLLVLSFLLSALNNTTNAQVKGDSATAAGGNFNTSGSRVSWMGSNYRKEWNTPITVPVINLSNEHGGLTPEKRGGGKQTKSLRLSDPNGREYTLRSITKVITSKTLPGDLQSEAAIDLVSDGVSASYPYAALSIPVLAEAAGIPHGGAKLVYIPDDPKLGEFRKEFANMMALYEERLPDTVKKVYNSDEVMEKLEKDNDNDVGQEALLRIRILDMFIMDLDRHEGQWSWGAWDNGKGKTFYPIAKDRDQAFYINRGLLPGIVKGKSLVPQLEGFKAKAHNISRFNFAARNFDRFFLNQLSEEDWKKEAESFVSKMTDAVIENSLAQQPNEIRGISAGKIIQTLKDRRNYIVAEVMQYYRFLAQIVSITGSDKNEQYSITRNDDGTMLVQVFKITKEGNLSTKMYERKFDPSVTKEVRIYGFDGDDKFIETGSVDKIITRLIGGGGADAFENTSKENGTMVYDRSDGNNTVKGEFRNKMRNDTLVNSYNFLGYKYNFSSFFGTLGYNPDDGFMIGPTFKLINQGFRKTPYKSMHQFKSLYAFSTNAFSLKYNNEFISVFGKKTDLITNIELRGKNNTSNFFGYGVNSMYDKTKEGKFKFYRIRYNLRDFALQLRHRFSDKVMVELGPSYEHYSMDSAEDLNQKRNVIINTATSGLNPATLFEDQAYIGAKLSLIIDTRNNKVLPEKGVNWITTLKQLNGLTDKSYNNVTRLNSDFTFYLKLIPDRLVFANRMGFGVTMGADGFEFYQAQYLGSDDNLRGFRKERFAGRSKFYNQAEFRLRLANLRTYLFPASFGMFAFVDAGRVWVKNDTDNKILTGFGGGFWFAPLRRLLIRVSYAVSSEDHIPLFGFGWKF